MKLQIRLIKIKYSKIFSKIYIDFILTFKKEIPFQSITGVFNKEKVLISLDN
jgi:hypothetical protein